MSQNWRRTLSLLAVLLLGACSPVADDPAARFVADWRGPDGQPTDRGPTEFELRVQRGAEHCDWTSVVFLAMAWPLGTTYRAGVDAEPWREFVRDAEGVLSRPELHRRLELDAELPEDAVATGYENGDVELWLGPDRADEFVYLVSENGTERWPRAQEPIGCA